MTGDEFLDRLRKDAAPLRNDAEEETLRRLGERVCSSISALQAERDSTSGVLAGWLRPVLAGLAAASLAAVGALVWLGSEPTDVLLAGADTAFVHEVPDADLP